MPPVTESEVFSASEGMRGVMDYYAHATSTSKTFERLSDLQPPKPVNMGAHIVVTVPGCFGNWPLRWKGGRQAARTTGCRNR